MLELGLAALAVGAVLALGWLRGRFGTAALQAQIEREPQQVARLYLRQVDELEAWWLHVELRNGRKRVLAAPWEAVAVLARLQAHGLELDAADAARLAGENGVSSEAESAELVRSARSSASKRVALGVQPA